MENNIIFHSEVEQRSQEWYDLRLGKFTGSPIENICKPKGFGKTGETYINSILAEILTGKMREIPQTFSMQWGEMYEPVARQTYISAIESMGKTINIQEVGFLENTLYKNCGASPDGIDFDNKTGYEIKCPENPSNHVSYMEIKDQSDLKKIKPEYYWQILFCMLMAGFEQWNFISFHPDFTQHKDLRLWVVPIYWNDTDMDFLINRIGEANIMLTRKLEEKGIFL